MIPSKKSAAKRNRIMRLRKSIRELIADARGYHCEACHLTPVGSEPPRRWTDLHEILTRGRGGDPTDPNNILCVCSECHKWITEHEEDARLLGLVRVRTADEHLSIFRTWEKDTGV